MPRKLNIKIHNYHKICFTTKRCTCTRLSHENSGSVQSCCKTSFRLVLSCSQNFIKPQRKQWVSKTKNSFVTRVFNFRNQVKKHQPPVPRKESNVSWLLDVCKIKYFSKILFIIFFVQRFGAKKVCFTVKTSVPWNAKQPLIRDQTFHRVIPFWTFFLQWLGLLNHLSMSVKILYQKLTRDFVHIYSFRTFPIWTFAQNPFLLIRKSK